MSSSWNSVGQERDLPPCPMGTWPTASWDAVSRPPANTTVWEWSLLESQLAELMPGHHGSSWEGAAIREGWWGWDHERLHA